jgi:hypothetical protein
MKKKLAVGDQIDLNADFEGGGIDASVLYVVPSPQQQDVVSVSPSGVITALEEGTATIEVKDAITGRLLRAVVIQVLAEAAHEIQVSLDSGLAGGPGTEFLASFVTLSSGNDNSGGGVGAGELILPNMTSNNSNGYSAWLMTSMNASDAYLYGNRYWNVETSTGEAYEAFDANTQSGGIYALSHGGYYGDGYGAQSEIIVDSFMVGIALPVAKNITALVVEATGHGLVRVVVEGMYAGMIQTADGPDYGGSWVQLGSPLDVDFGATTSLQSMTPSLNFELQNEEFRKIRVNINFYPLTVGGTELMDKGYITVHNIKIYGA